MKKALNAISLVMLVAAILTTVMPVHANVQFWNDAYGGTVGGQTWFHHQSPWWYADAQTWRNPYDPHYIYVKVEGWSWCGYAHLISELAKSDNYRPSLAASTLVGSNQCPENAQWRIESRGTHRVQVYPGTNNVGGNTMEPKILSR